MIIKNYWMTSSGRFIEVADHFKIIEDSLKGKYTQEEYYDILSRQGHLRIVETRLTIIIGYNEFRRLTDKQISLLKDFAIEKKKELLIERRDIRQRYGLETVRVS
jgi:hypothetical protein